MRKKVNKVEEEERKKKIKELKRQLFILEHTKNCCVCGKEFFTERTSKYCSSNCRHKAYVKNLTEEERLNYYERQKLANIKYRKRKAYEKYQENINNWEIPDIYYSSEIINYNGFYGNY